jgi:hypothetical protein
MLVSIAKLEPQHQVIVGLYEFFEDSDQEDDDDDDDYEEAEVESDSEDPPQAPPLQSSSSSSSLSIEKVLNDDVDEDIISISDGLVIPSSPSLLFNSETNELMVEKLSVRQEHTSDVNSRHHHRIINSTLLQGEI